jgi:N-acetylglucosamine-6-phosphate deacetylase
VGDVDVEDGRIAAVGLARGPRGRVAIPGFVDLQVNGYGGVDFLSASTDDYRRAGEALLLAGVTAYQPTFITSAEAVTVEALRAMPTTEPGPRILGAHVEGPFLSPDRPGTHPLEHLRAPDVALLDRLLDAGQVTQMTLAPELPGADALIDRLRERGIAVSAGHTNATAAEAHHAFDCGVGGVTHVFNAMRPFRSRDPGIAGAALTRAGVVIAMVVDGHHLADETVRLVWACAAGRVALVTDAMAAAGTARNGGRYQLGDVAVAVEDGAAPMREDGTLAGTVLTMIDAMRNLHALGVPFEQAVGAATEVPARFLARGDVGFLEPGAQADALVLDDRLEIQAVLCAGRSDVVARG